MSIDTTSASTGTAGSIQAAAAAATKNSASAIASDFETFLKMLTTQLQNQDPLNPIDSSDYAVQLATFAGVEQQVQTNDLLKSLGAGGAMGGLAQYSGWVGMDARVENKVQIDGAPVELNFDLPAGTKKAELVVKTTSGLELHRRDLTSATSPYIWDGKSPSGDDLLKGEYDLSIETTSSSGATDTIPVSTYSRVSEVRSSADGAEIVLTNGQVVAPSEITALRGS
jgi:flagellar basal-body rod modification protein FlgD